MISHTIKHNNQVSAQSGVALMLSVLVLAAVTAIAFSLATIVFIELRSSRDVVRSEPALYATLGVTEEALFQYKRAIDESVLDVPNCFPNNQNICSLNGVSMLNPAPEILAEDEVPKVVTVYKGQTVTLPMFEIGKWEPVFGKIDVKLVPLGSLGSLVVKANWIDTQVNSGTDDIAIINEKSGRVSWSGFLANRQYELELTNPTTNNLSVSIWSYDIDNSTPKGLPFIAKRVLKIVADYSGFTRTYIVEIPVGTSTLGGG